MRKFFGIFILLVALCAPAVISTAAAQEDVAQQVEALSREGADHFRAGEYDEAIALFEEAYALEPVPNLLFNIGRCYEQLEQWEQSKAYYEQFITSPDVASEAREQAMDRVDSLDEIMAAEAREAEDEESDADEDQDVVADPEPVDDAPSMVPGIAASSVGAGLIIGGVILGSIASNQADLLTDDSLSYDERLQAQDQARSMAFGADGFYVAGGLTLAAGAYLLYRATSYEDSTDQAQILTPWLSGDSAGVGVHFDF